jgi:predicted N-acyltransferase
VITRSAHFIADPNFRAAVEQFLNEERRGIANDILWLRRALPYRMSSSA